MKIILNPIKASKDAIADGRENTKNTSTPTFCDVKLLSCSFGVLQLKKQLQVGTRMVV